MISRLVIVFLFPLLALPFTGNAVEYSAGPATSSGGSEVSEFLTLLHHTPLNNISTPSSRHIDFSFEPTVIEEEEQDSRPGSGKKKLAVARVTFEVVVSLASSLNRPAADSTFGHAHSIKDSSRLHLVLQVFRV